MKTPDLERKTKWDQNVDWDKISQSMQDIEEDDWDDNILLPRDKKDGKIKPAHPPIEQHIEIKTRQQGLQPHLDHTQQWLEGLEHKGPGGAGEAYIDQDMTM